MQQTRVGIMRWTFSGCNWMTFGRFGMAEDFLCRNQELDVVEFVAFRWIHAPSISGSLALCEQFIASRLTIS